MGVTIVVRAGEQEPAALAELITSKFGARAAFKTCGREIVIARTTENEADLKYWIDVLAGVVKISGEPAFEVADLPICATPDEGVRLNNIFSRIASSASRQRIFEAVISHLRQDPIE